LSAALAGPAPRSRGLRISLRALENRLIWLLVATSFVVIVEPAPYEFLFAAILPVFLAAGLRLRAGLIPLLLLVMAYNLAAGIAVMPYLHEARSVQYAFTSIYLGLTAIVFAAVVAEDPESRLKTITSAWILAGVVVSVLGILGYFDVAGTGAIWSLNFRATGTFKDPNVFGPFVAVPALVLVQRLLTGTSRRPLLDFVALLILLGGVFFSFSRGAWGIIVIGAVLCALVTLATTQSLRTRLRIVVLGTLGALLLAGLLVAVLSIDGVSELFEDRATLLKEYDSGPKGRFGQIPDMILWLLDHPLGWGPLITETRAITAPHNQYVSAFGNFGWLGGLSYLTLIVVTCYVGWRSIAARTPWQMLAIPYWIMLFMQILQGLQIDTNNWRHFWLLLGIVWGFAIRARDTAADDRSPMPPASPSG
jgi:O-antigen ligase